MEEVILRAAGSALAYSQPIFYRAGSALKKRRGKSVESVGGGKDRTAQGLRELEHLTSVPRVVG